MKKVLSLALVLVLVLGMSTVAFANQKVDKNSGTTGYASGGQQAYILKDGASADDSWGDVIVQTYDSFDWVSDSIDFGSSLAVSSGAKPTFATGANVGNTVDVALGQTGVLTEKEVKDSKITLKTVITKGNRAIDEVKIVYQYDTKVTFTDPDNSKNFTSQYDPRVKITFKDKFVNNNPEGIEFEVKVYLVVDGRQWADSGYTLGGDYMNDHETYYETTDGSVFMADGTIQQATGYMKEVEMELGEGVFAYGKMFKDRNYYGVANIDVYDKDEEFMDKYELDAVYHIDEAGLKAVVEYVLLENEDSTSYVYGIDSNGNLVDLGKKGNERLDLRDTYYLSTKQLDVDEEVEPEEGGDPSDAPEDPSDGGGDDYPDNVNDNPGTGR